MARKQQTTTAEEQTTDNASRRPVALATSFSPPNPSLRPLPCCFPLHQQIALHLCFAVPFALAVEISKIFTQAIGKESQIVILKKINSVVSRFFPFDNIPTAVKVLTSINQLTIRMTSQCIVVMASANVWRGGQIMRFWTELVSNSALARV